MTDTPVKQVNKYRDNYFCTHVLPFLHAYAI